MVKNMRKNTKENGYTFARFQSISIGKIRPMYCYVATKKGVAKIEDLNSKNSKHLVPKSNDIILHYGIMLNGEHCRQFFGEVNTEDECNKILVVLIKQMRKGKQ